MGRMRRRVYLNPDGSHPAGLAVIVYAETGIVYATQCGSSARVEREAEGYLVPCPADGHDGEYDIQGELQQWFSSHAPRGESADTLSSALIEELAAIVARVMFWTTSSEPEQDDSIDHLVLDTSRLSECIAAWMPVRTPQGRGILTFDNAD